MAMTRRDFVKTAAIGAAGIAATAKTGAAQTPAIAPAAGGAGYDYRIAFGAWINDMRLEPLPLENWPAPQMDDETVRSTIAALELQSRSGYTHLDAWGFFVTHSWPLNLGAGIDDTRKRNVRKIIDAAHKRGMKIIYGMGTYSWGYEEIIKNDPSLAARLPDGTPLQTAMCDANPKSFEWVSRILDFVLTEFDMDGVHLESFDQGGCCCTQCAGGPEGVVGYHCRINTKTADYIRSKWPNKLINVIPIGWVGPKQHFTAEHKAMIIEMSRHIDGFYDQGWKGTYVADDERAQFVRDLHCAYGTSGALWLYPSHRFDRTSYFLPYTKRQGAGIKKHFEQGARGCMYYQGPANNPGVEVNVAFGGRILKEPGRELRDVLAETLGELYRPRNAAALDKLADIFERAEDAYFGQWVMDDHFDTAIGGPPGEFYMDGLFGTSPGPAAFMSAEHYLNAAGRAGYKEGLEAVLRDFLSIEGEFKDAARVAALKRSIIVSLTILNTIISCKG